jgi:hypothetical protein
VARIGHIRPRPRPFIPRGENRFSLGLGLAFVASLSSHFPALASGRSLDRFCSVRQSTITGGFEFSRAGRLSSEPTLPRLCAD